MLVNDKMIYKKVKLKISLSFVYYNLDLRGPKEK